VRYSYYPGCSLSATSVEYDMSVRAALGALGIELEEIEGWTCCGASSAHATDEVLSLALPLRNLAMAERMGRDMLVPCAACYNASRRAWREVTSGTELGARAVEAVRDACGMEFEGSIRPVHPLEVLSGDPLRSAIAGAVKRPLDGLGVAAYYGCLLLRPADAVAFDDPENPSSMEGLLEALGARAVVWSYRVDCCGAGLGVARPDATKELVGRIARDAVEAGADALVTACPLCQTNLDSRQARLPSFYFTELLGAALGLDGSPWWRKHVVDPRPLLRSHGLDGRAGATGAKERCDGGVSSHA